jgi:ribose transport system permease protein
MKLMSRKSLSNFLSKYCMPGVLLLLCLYYSWATIDHRQAAGTAGGEECSAVLLSQSKLSRNVAILVGTSIDNDGFADRAKNNLQSHGIANVIVISGDPHDIRVGLQKMIDVGTPPEAILCTADEVQPFEQLRAGLPAISNVPAIVPPTHAWPTFLTTNNLFNVANQIVVIAILAVGMTMVIITGGIDLSVGSLVALSAVVTGVLIRDYAGGSHAGVIPMAMCCVAGILVCGMVGAFTGGMITVFKVPPFIITLSMMLVASGRAYTVVNGGSVYDVPPSFGWLGAGNSFGRFPNAVILMIVVYAVAHIVLSRTRLGRYIYAVGGNAEAARLSGVPVNLVVLTVYILSGLAAGLGGVVVASNLGGSAATYGLSYELYAIAAVVVGGTSLMGGEGNVTGTLVGALIIAVIRNGMNLTGVAPFRQAEVLGWVILGALWLDSLKRTSLRLPNWLRQPESRGFDVVSPIKPTETSVVVK